MYVVARRFLFMLSPEKAHVVSLRLLRILMSIFFIRWFVRRFTKATKHSVFCFGLEFGHPVGLAAGFDKNADYIDLIEDLNFAFIEVGSVTNRPSLGNAKPRLFRLQSDEGIINRMGLNNQGSDVVAQKLSKRKITVPLFINIAKTPDKSMSEAEIIDDYCQSIQKLKSYADVMVLNISCPNADGGRTFEDPELLTALLTQVRTVLSTDECPLLIKVSPDLSAIQLGNTVRVCETFDIDGYTATNTTVRRDGLNASDERLNQIGNGGLSGKPLHGRAVEVVRQLSGLTDKPIVGVGGVFDAQSAQDFLDAGASLVQLYSGFVYGGPSVVKRITRGIIPNPASAE